MQKPAFNGVPCDSVNDALGTRDAMGGAAISLGGGSWVVTEKVADALATSGVEFAFLCNHMGRVVTVPVN